jgi:hypothetical protein
MQNTLKGTTAFALVSNYTKRQCHRKPYSVWGFAFFSALIVYFYSEHWLKTRVFFPLDVSVNLDTRQLKAPPFQVAAL